MTGGRLNGRRLLLAEDDWFIASDMARSFREAGAEVVGPVASIADALAAIEAAAALDGAVVDINLRGEMAFPVVEALSARAVPIVFATGYDTDAIPPRYAHIPRCEKPVDPALVVRALFG